MTKLETWIESDDYADEDGGDDADEDGNWCNYGWIDANLGELMKILGNLGKLMQFGSNMCDLMKIWG